MAGVLREMAGSGGKGGVSGGGWRIAPLTRGLVVVDVNSLQLERRVTHVASGRVDAMFVADPSQNLKGAGRGTDGQLGSLRAGPAGGARGAAARFRRA